MAAAARQWFQSIQTNLSFKTFHISNKNPWQLKSASAFFCFTTSICRPEHLLGTKCLALQHFQQQLSKHAVWVHKEGLLSVRSHWCTQDWKAPLSRSEGIWGANAALTRRICVTLANSWQLLFQALPTPAFSFCFPSFCPCSLCRTAGTNNPQAAVIWPAMSLANLRGSKRGLVLSALLVCAVIFELGKWLVYFASLRSSMEQHISAGFMHEAWLKYL